MFSAASPLRDPVFVLQWQVHLVTVSLFAVFGIWWGTTRRPWYLPPLIFFGLLWLFVPQEAPEPALVLLVATPILALTSGAIQWWWHPRDGATGPVSANYRLTLRDALWLTLFVALILGLAVQLRRFRWIDDFAVIDEYKVLWTDIAINAACLLAISIAVLALFAQRTGLRTLAAAAATLFVLLTAAGVHFKFVIDEFLLISSWNAYTINMRNNGFTVVKSPTYYDVLLVYLLSFFEFALLLALGRFAIAGAFQSRRGLRSTIARIVAAAPLLGGVVVVSLVYAAMLNPPRWPVEDYPATNQRGTFLSIIKQQHAINPNSASLQDLRASGDSTAASKLAVLFSELEKLLEDATISLFDSRTDQLSIDDNSSRVQEARGMCRALAAQAEAEWACGNRGEALRLQALNLRLGSTMQRRCTGLDAVVGAAIEHVPVDFLIGVRDELTCKECESAILVLREIASDRESQHLMLQRDAAYVETCQSWMDRVWLAANRVLNRPNQRERGWQTTCLRRDTLNALLQTELAIRCYREREGIWPSELNALVPEYLPDLSADPFSALHEPLIYRSDEEGYVLYSLGPNGSDDGGFYGTSRDWWDAEKNLDIDVELWTDVIRYEP